MGLVAYWIALPKVLAEDKTQSNPDSAVAITASKTPMNLALIFWLKEKVKSLAVKSRLKPNGLVLSLPSLP